MSREEDVIAAQAYKRLQEEKLQLLKSVQEHRDRYNRWRGIIASALRPGKRAIASEILQEHLEKSGKPVTFSRGLEIAERFGAELDPLSAEQDFSRSIKVSAGKGSPLKVRNNLIGLKSWPDSLFDK